MSDFKPRFGRELSKDGHTTYVIEDEDSVAILYAKLALFIAELEGRHGENGFMIESISHTPVFEEQHCWFYVTLTVST